MTRVRLGISTCPNDTFAFHALMEKKVPLHGLEFDIELLDVQELNRSLFGGRFDVAKASFHAALLLAERYLVLPSGSALGFGVGPLLLGSPHPSARSEPIVLCPGEQTTATLLYRVFHPNEARVKNVVFSEIMPALERGDADFGVCIHEGRFTWQQRGLRLVEDLGERFERQVNAPLPLGGILAARSLESDVLKAVQSTIHASLLFARANPDAPLPTMRRHAQELDDAVIRAHVDLYVNPLTVDLGDVGRSALSALARLARESGAVLTRDLEVLPWSTGSTATT